MKRVGAQRRLGLGDERAGGRGPLRRVLGHPPRDHLVDGRPEARGRRCEVSRDEAFDRGRRRERGHAGETLEQHAAQGVDVGGCPDRARAEPFRRHVAERPGRGAGAGETGVRIRLREAEIHQVCEVPVVDEDVVGLHVPVAEPAAMGGVEGVGDLPDDLQGTLGGQRPGVGEQGAQVPTVDQSHVDEQSAVDLAPVVDRDDMGVVQLRGDPRFAQEPVTGGGIAGDRRAEELQGDDPALARVGGAVDLAHPAAADELVDRVGAEARAAEVEI